MICISICQESRRFALVDMHNAAPQCDLLEVRLDRFGKAPEISELLAAKPKPVIMSCRRPQDGGHWDGTEDERLAILRQCIISKADYVEIELDAADSVRPFPGCKRVISYTNLDETPADLADLYAFALTKQPDVIKLTTLARTPEEAWPLVQVLGKASVPTVAVGLGKPGVMLAVLGKKIGAPWTYAALERGMEAHPGQPTVHDLEQVYHYRAIDRNTLLVGVTGFERREYVTVGLLNAALAHLKLSARCLPLGVGSVRVLRKVLAAVHLPSVIVDEENQGRILEIATELQPAARQARAADTLVHQGEKWHAAYLLDRAAVAALEGVLRARTPADKPLAGRTVMLVGVTPLTRLLAERIAKHGGILILAAREREAVHQLAQELKCRYVLLEAVYSTLHDVLIVCSDEAPAAGRSRDAGLRASYLKSGMTVMDLTSPLVPSPLLAEARQRGCGVVDPRQVLLEQVARQFKLISGKDAPRDRLQQTLAEMCPDEE
jgi:3-dehydroquinate dehydratase/shikimate dehydrogenase